MGFNQRGLARRWRQLSIAPACGHEPGPRVTVGTGEGVAVGSTIPRRWQAWIRGVASTVPTKSEARRRN